jgi:hypothetical protein
MFDTVNMPRKAKPKPFVLPSDFKELNTYVVDHKKELMEKVISSIEFALEKNIPVVEVFGFTNSDFVVAISQSEFRNNITHIYNFYIQNEWYELCGRVKKVESLLDTKLKNR